MEEEKVTMTADVERACGEAAHLFLEGRRGEVGRARSRLCPFSSQTSTTPSSVALLSSALPPPSIPTNILRHAPPTLHHICSTAPPLLWAMLLQVQPSRCPSTGPTRTLSLQRDHIPLLEVDASHSIDPPSWEFTTKATTIECYGIVGRS